MSPFIKLNSSVNNTIKISRKLINNHETFTGNTDSSNSNIHTLSLYKNPTTPEGPLLEHPEWNVGWADR